MANTRYLTLVVEDHVRQELARRVGQPFTKVRVALTTGGSHEFDAVSADRSVVASIKSASGKTAGGRNPAGKIKDSLAELYYLSLVDAPTRLLVLTTPEFFDIFTKVIHGAVADGIKILCIPLPAEMQAEADEVKRQASQEVSPTRAPPLPSQRDPSWPLVDDLQHPGGLE